MNLDCSKLNNRGSDVTGIIDAVSTECEASLVRILFLRTIIGNNTEVSSIKISVFL